MSAQVDLYAAARDLVNQPPPPSLREILSAYRAKGDGDRDMLLAMLNAKAAEEQSLSNRTALCRTLLESQQYSYSPSPQMHEHYYPTPSTSVHSPSHVHSVPPSKRSPRHVAHHHHRSHSPYTLAPMNESRRRHRASHSPPRQPPSPYSPVSSSSSIPDSPRSARPSMAIGALLSNRSQADAIKQLSDVSDERFKARDYPMVS